jgi:hypothetical protein
VGGDVPVDSEGDAPVDSETFLVIDFVNLKIKSTQSFGSVHRGRLCAHMLIGVSTYMCISIYVYTVFLKKEMDGRWIVTTCIEATITRERPPLLKWEN